jgi:hypothetical protein
MNNLIFCCSVGSNGNIDTSGQAGIYCFQISSFPTTFSSKSVCIYICANIYYYGCGFFLLFFSDFFFTKYCIGRMVDAFDIVLLFLVATGIFGYSGIFGFFFFFFFVVLTIVYYFL